MQSRKAVKVAGVVAVLIVAGLGVARLVSGGPAERMTGGGKFGPPGPQHFHSMLKLDDVNRGGPGVLSIRGTFQVAEPDLVGQPDLPDDIHFAVVVSVKDYENNVFVNNDMIGTGHDTLGRGHWSQDYTAEYQLPAGRYYVEMIAHDPQRKRTGVDGSQSPWVLGASGRHMVVE